MELNISPIDSRYSNLCDILRTYVSDFGINKIRMEAVQCVMKTEHIKDSYEYIKKLSRGEKINKETYFKIVNGVNISNASKAKLLALTPQTYLGFL